MTDTTMVECGEHGDTPWCRVVDGTHFDSRLELEPSRFADEIPDEWVERLIREFDTEVR
tara:strand:- start:934 stop:1110 length:177 start_codon:yes stop_codon:yes gene_type:complete